MSYAADWALSQTASFQEQVQMAVFKAATAISNEAATTHPTLDLKRHTLASQVLQTSGSGYGQSSGPINMQFVWAAIETGLTGTPTDAQVDTAISSIWNEVAGVTSRDLVNI